MIFRTPLVELDLHGAPVYLKIESQNPSGSHKDRVARAKILYLIRVCGLGRRPLTLLLSSSGNTGIAFAVYLAGIPGVRLIVVTDPLSPKELLAKLSRFPHVELIIVDEPDSNGSHLSGRLRRIDELKRRFPDAHILDQYGDPLFALAHEMSTAAEIIDQAEERISAIFVPTGTCATLLGLDLYKRRHNRQWALVPVDSEGSQLFEPNETNGRRVYSGYGNACPTKFSRRCMSISKPVRPSNVSVAKMANWLLTRHNLFLGPSSAAVAAAFVENLGRDEFPIPHWGRSVLLMPDAGDSYRNTLFSDDWLIEHGLGRAISGP